MGETNSSSSNEMRNLQKNQGSALANPSLHWKEIKIQIFFSRQNAWRVKFLN